MKTLPIVAIGALTAAVVFCGCETFSQRSHHRATSVMKFLYPHDTERVESTATPVLSLPLKVGVAFVPLEESKTERGWGLPVSDATVNEAQKLALMKEVSKHFEQYRFVKSIDLIPSAYLSSGGSFANLEQLRTMFGIDVIALLSYDQVQFTDENFLSLSYWTIVGLYTVNGERNDTHTMLDAVVYDIASRKMLFRAPGISYIKGGATPVDLSKELRQDSQKGFSAAASDLVTNLDFQLSEFKDRMKKSPEEIKVVAKPGYVGAAAVGGWEVVGVCGLALAGLVIPRARVSRRSLTQMRRLPVITLAVLIAAVVVQLWPRAAAALVYERQRVLCGEAWRLISANWVHFSASHFLYDALAFGAAGAFIELRGYKRFGLLCLLSPVVVGCTVLVGARNTSIFGGLSGLATGAVTFLCLQGLREDGLWKMICAATLAIVGGKIAIEWATQDMIFAHSGSVALEPMPVAHLAGAVTAFACCVRFPAFKPRDSKTGATSGIADRRTISPST